MKINTEISYVKQPVKDTTGVISRWTKEDKERFYNDRDIRFINKKYQSFLKSKLEKKYGGKKYLGNWISKDKRTRDNSVQIIKGMISDRNDYQYDYVDDGFKIYKEVA